MKNKNKEVNNLKASLNDCIYTFINQLSIQVINNQELQNNLALNQNLSSYYKSILTFLMDQNDLYEKKYKKYKFVNEKIKLNKSIYEEIINHNHQVESLSWQIRSNLDDIYTYIKTEGNYED